jgi:hypothetical protein
MSLSRCCCHFHAAAALSGCAGLGQWVEPTMYYAVVTILLYLMHVLSHPRPVDPTVSYFWIDGTCCSLLLTWISEPHRTFPAFFLKICHAHKNSIQLQQFLSIFLRKDFTKHIKNLNDFKNNTSTTKGGYPKKIVWTSICENITNYFKNNNNRL